MWTPADILTDLDLLALDRACLTDFGVTALADKRGVACDWAAARVEQAGHVLWRHRTRKAPDAVFGYNGATFTDYTAAASDTTAGDVPLSSILVAPTTNAVYVGYQSPFLGVHLGLTDNVNAAAVVTTAAVWSGVWRAVNSLADGTIAVAGKSLSGGGTMRWQRPDTWVRRSLNSSILHWAKLTISTSLTAATACSQMAPIVPSRLSLPCAYYALGTLYAESYGAQRGAWGDKADRFLASAQSALDVALPLIANEFDVDATDTVDHTEVSSVVAGNYATWERG